jgi:hypothetical protein
VVYRQAGTGLERPRRLGKRISNAIKFGALDRGHFLLVFDVGTGPRIHALDLVNGRPARSTVPSGPTSPDTELNLQSLAVGPDGQAAVAWSRLALNTGAPTASTELFVSYRGAGQGFEPPEPVTAHPDDAYETNLGFDGDSPVAIFVASPTSGMAGAPEFIETSTRR